jgi:acetyl esterase/lipase
MNLPATTFKFGKSVAIATIVSLGPWAVANGVWAAAPKTDLLWPNGAPDAKGEKPADKPTINLFTAPAEKATGAGVVITPGGGYGGVMMSYEGNDVAVWLNTLGISAIVLDYRHAGRGYHHPAPLEDAQRAIRTLRSKADEWKLDTHKVGILGFSAGGHLASSAGTHFDAGKPDAADPIERLGCRPDFMVLIYPVITLTEPSTHAGSRQNLLGDHPDPKLVESMSSEKQVTPQTPPTFLVSSSEDSVVPSENSILFFQALRKAKVPAELHIFEKGQHGFGMSLNNPATSWTPLCANWFRVHGLTK